MIYKIIKEVKMGLGQAIKIISEEKKLSKYKVAKMAGVPQATFLDIVNGKTTNPTLDTISKIATGLGISASELIAKAEKV
jgi:transcriptional regulator with XRE-family HTH domain